MKIKHYILASLAIASAMSITSCNDNDDYDVVGNPNNLVFTDDYSTTSSVVQIPGATIAGLDIKIPAKCNKMATSDIKVTFVIDNSLIDAYNAENGTEYLPVPENALVLTNQTVTIPAGQYKSVDAFGIALTDNADALATIDNEKGYLIPVRIDATQGAQKASSVKSESYIVINVTHTVIDPDATTGNRQGSLVQDRSEWTVTPATGTTASGNLSLWFDGNNRNHSAIESDGDFAVAIVDLGKEYSFDGIFANYYYVYWGNYGYEEGCFNNTKLYISSDKSEWTSVGVVESDGYSNASFVGFYGMVTARYIKIEQPATEDWYGNSSASFDCGDFNIYAK